jgi:hypothetical protein
MNATLTVTQTTAGIIDDAEYGPPVTAVGVPRFPRRVTKPATPFPVPPGVYDVEQVDDGDIWLVVDEVPDVCVIIHAADVDLVECIECGGRGEWTYRVALDDWESDTCGGCDGLGYVTPDVEATQLANHRAYLEEMYANG